MHDALLMEPAPAQERFDTLEALRAMAKGLDPSQLLSFAIDEVFPERIALVSSFGADSAVLLHLASQIDRDLPVLFLETGKHFAETLAYVETLERRLGLTNVIRVRPDSRLLSAQDSSGTLWSSEPDRCCDLRKVRPLARTLAGYDAWITGRKRYQAATRADLPLIEREGAHIKINPLASFTSSDIADYLEAHDLPAHPLVGEGYPSIGCATCTSRVEAGEDPRAGRWRGQAKKECGIHFVDGKLVRG